MPKHYHKPSKLYQRWTQEEDDQLQTMVLKGKNSEQIARALGRTRVSIFARKAKLGIGSRMEPARGSGMPYTSFSRQSRNGVPTSTSIEEKKAPSPTPTPAPVEPKEPRRYTPSLGTQIDSIIKEARTKGLKLSITIASEDTSWL